MMTTMPARRASLPPPSSFTTPSCIQIAGTFSWMASIHHFLNKLRRRRKTFTKSTLQGMSSKEAYAFSPSRASAIDGLTGRWLVALSLHV